MDGAPDEFCDVPGQALDASNWVHPFFFHGASASDIHEKATVRVAASADGLRIHVHVTDATVFVSTDPLTLHEGDSIEVYAAGFVPTHGDFDGTVDIGARHIILAPPSGPGFGARALVWDSTCPGTPSPQPLDTSFFAGRLVADGWELELALPWSFLTAPATTPPSSGAQVGFTLALNAQDDAAAGGRQVQAFLGYQTIGSSPSCAACTKTEGEPFCDDRTWCTPTLQ